MEYSVAQRLYLAALENYFFNIEDVLVTGILSRKIGVRPLNSSRFHGQIYAPRDRALREKYFVQVLESHFKEGHPLSIAQQWLQYLRGH